MSSKILSITLLLLSVYVLSSAGNLRHPFRRFPPPCCVTLSHENISAYVTRNTYREQSAGSPCVKAIILTTDHGQVCVDPKAEWVKKLIATMRKQ